MVIERRWKKWVFFYIPLSVFVIGTLFPFYWMLVTAIRPDAELYRSWRAVDNGPLWNPHPRHGHLPYPMGQTKFPRGLERPQGRVLQPPPQNGKGHVSTPLTPL